MQTNITYRIAAPVLTVVFAVFNIGLPLVVASCPMPKPEGSSLCAMCYDDGAASTPTVTTERNTSCCETKFAADRNATEFLQSQQKVDKCRPAVEAEFVDLSYLLHHTSFLSRLFAIASSPPPSRDIPLFVSSLLI